MSKAARILAVVVWFVVFGTLAVYGIWTHTAYTCAQGDIVCQEDGP